jgi:hypothetical protein
MGRWFITGCFFKKKELMPLVFKIKNLSLQLKIKYVVLRCVHC